MPVQNEASALRPSLADLVALRAKVQAWPPPRRARSGMSGLGTSPFRGRGMDYAETRAFSAGDDARHVDWRVSARTGRLHTKLFHAERERVALLVADTSPGLYFGTRRCFKSVQLARAAALIAWSAQRSGDRIGILRAGEAPIAPRAGSRGVLRVLAALERWYAQPPVRDGGLTDALAAAARLLKPGARVFVLADPAALAAVPDAALRALTAHDEALCVLVCDPIELDPPHRDLHLLLGARPAELALAQAEGRRRWQAMFADVLDAQRRRLHAFGIRAPSLSTADEVETLMPWLAGRR